MDAEWRGCFGAWPPSTVAARQKLEERAAGLAASVDALPPELGGSEVDVVCHGCGFLILYFMGAHQVLSRVRGLTLKRYSGASSSGQAPMQILLDGESAAVDSYVAYGELQDRHKPWLGMLGAAWRCDGHWREYGQNLVDRRAADLPSLNGRHHVSVSCLRPLPKNLIISDFDSPDDAKQTWYATGTALTKCRGHWATDGGVTNVCPMFDDGVRPSVVVNPTKAGLPLSMAVRYSLASCIEAMEKGQDDMAAYLKGQAPAGEGPIQTASR